VGRPWNKDKEGTPSTTVTSLCGGSLFFLLTAREPIHDNLQSNGDSPLSYPLGSPLLCLIFMIGFLCVDFDDIKLKGDHIDVIKIRTKQNLLDEMPCLVF
jgi:hypothetical protein